MAEIPVEKKSGMPWWGWLTAALAVLALIWLVFGDSIENEVDAQSSVTGTDGAATIASNIDAAPSLNHSFETYL